VDGNVKLERLVLSNNSIATLADFQIANLPELKSLHMDCNKISAISDNDLLVLQKSPKLVSLTLDGNNISWIGCGAFEPVGNLVVLSLQRNKIASLSCSSTRDPSGIINPCTIKCKTFMLFSAFSVYLDRSVLEPLKSLRTLLLSYNNIVVINDDDLTGLESIRNLALDHNLINKVAKNSFDGLKLKKLFLNSIHITPAKHANKLLIF
jgi:Leucine-rich repeat (LRR) protein